MSGPRTPGQIQYAKAKAAGNKRRADASVAMLRRQLADLLPDLVAEHRFQPERGGRSMRFDLASPFGMIAFEVEGGTWRGGSRHTSGSGFHRDCLKYGDAASRGWTVLRLTPDMIGGPEVRRWTEALVEALA